MSEVAGEGQPFTDSYGELWGSNITSIFVSDPGFLMDMQLASENMDTAIGFDMDRLLNNPELFGDSII